MAARICPTSPSCTPVFDDAKDKNILFWVASRGHHADVGGTAPGSMTPLATTVEEEGRAVRQFPARRSRPLLRGIRQAPDRPPLPGPQSVQNVADLKAQIAANEKGVRNCGR
jgi:5-oxoprolinase (ATP-hydrolysing)